MRGVEVLAGLLAPEEADAACGEEGAELDVGERRVDLAFELLVADLALLGDAGADEHDPELGSVLPVQHARDRDHRRDDGREAVDDVGMVLAHVADHRRAGGGDVAPVVLPEKPHVLLGDEVGAEADLVDSGEPEVAEGADQSGRAALRELGRVAGRHDGHDRRVGVQELFGRLDAAEDLFGVLAAHGDAVATADAARLDDARLAVLDLDGLRRALAHAGVAPAALLPDGGDQLQVGDPVLVHRPHTAALSLGRRAGRPPWRGAPARRWACRSRRPRSSWRGPPPNRGGSSARGRCSPTC